MATPMNKYLFEWPSVLALLLLFPLFLLLSSKRTISSKKSRLPPSPPKLPFVGNLHQLGSLPHRSLRDLSKKYGPLMLLDLGQVPTLMVSSTEMAQEIMRTHDLIFASRPPLKVAEILLYGGYDIGFAPLGEHWRQVRKISVIHLLSQKMVQSFQPLVKEEVSSMIAKISQSASSSSSGVVNMSKVLNSLTNDIICRAVSGKFFKDGRNEMFKEVIDENTALLGGFHLGEYFPNMGWLDVFFGMKRRAQRNFRKYDGVLEAVINQHAEQWKDEEHKERTFVDVLLALQKDPNTKFALTNDHIKALLSDMFSAGTDTTYIILEWCLAELVRNSEAMVKLQNEVRSIASTGKTMVSEEDLSKMIYLKAVIKEVLRLHPAAPLLIPRETMEDCKIDGCEIPRKTRVIVNAWAICRDPKYWEAPDEFRPERFIGSSTDFRGNDFQFIPFGAGRRICPGMNFAVSTLELALANLAYRFDWELPTGMTRDDLDMTDTPGLTAGKKERLDLIAKPFSA